ncbi:MAG: hypothetical protein JNJ97_07835 [Alphaproteobacteria bacterium]|nr:hypothetical protein [Alphaproteobacteria bacterium]MCA0449309.1 hypothetical protein [Pseudomonadota bacterium]
MSSEYRIVFFEDREIVVALIEHARTQGMKLPPGRVIKMGVDRASFTVKLVYAKKGEPPKPVEFDASALSQAMIRHCKGTGIPLPMRARKELRFVDGRIAFVVQLERPATDALIPLEYVN